MDYLQWNNLRMSSEINSSSLGHLKFVSRSITKAKIALLAKLTILGRSWTHVPKNQIPIADQRARDFKEEFQEYTVGVRGGCMQSTVISDSQLEIFHGWSDQCHLGCFKYS